jgi:hypothetical protein
VISARIGELELLEGSYEDDPTMRVKVNFPFYVGTGTKNSAVVYFELEPGHRLGTHTDSAEEILLILEGEAEATVGDEQGRVSVGGYGCRPGYGAARLAQCGRRNGTGRWVLLEQRYREHVRPADDAFRPTGCGHSSRPCGG